MSDSVSVSVSVPLVPVSVPASPIITTNIKQNLLFKEHLANLAKSDTHHDLKDVLTLDIMRNVNINTAFNNGIPTPATNYYGELESLASVIMRIDGTDINNKDFLLRLNNVSNVTFDNSIPPTSIEIGIPNMAPIFNYTVVQFVMPCDNNKNISPQIVPYDKPNFGRTFFENTKLADEAALLIVDFSQHHFIEKLIFDDNEDPDSLSPYTLHYLMTPEVVNDPAGKQNVHNKSIFKKNQGVNLFSHVEFSPDSTYYNAYDETDESTSNNFFSNFDFILSPIKQTFTKQKSEKLITDLTISFTNPDTLKPYVDDITDSKSENSNKTVMGYLKKMIDKIANFKSNTQYKWDYWFNFNSKCQQKRGGDWFQILSCLDAKNRLFTEISPAENGRIQKKISKDFPVYLVTHDRIAVSYALLNGVNVIYLDYYGRIFVFKNSADISTKGNGKPIEEIIFNNMISKFPDNEIDELIIYSEKYNNIVTNIESYNDQLKTFYDQINISINEATLEISVLLVDNFNFKNMFISIKKIFFATIKYIFLKLNLIEITKEIVFVKNNKYILKGNYADNDKSIIMMLNRYINTLKNIYNKYGQINDENAFRNGLGVFLEKNSINLEVYSCVKKLFEGREPDLEKDLTPTDRLVDINFDTGIKETDKYIFLPFISQLNKDEYKDFKLLVINSLILVGHKMQEYLNFEKLKLDEKQKQNGFLSFLKTVSRSNRLAPNLIDYNRVVNLLYQSFLFLNNEGIPSNSSELVNLKDVSSSAPVAPKPDESENKSSLSLAPVTPKDDSQSVPVELNNAINEILDFFKLDYISDHTDNIILEEDVNNILATMNGIISCDPSNLIEEQKGGFKYFFDNASANIKTQKNTVCDISIKQVTWKLITSYLTDDNKIYELFHTINTAEDYRIINDDNNEDIKISDEKFTRLLTDKYNYYSEEKKGGGLPELIVGESNPPPNDTLLQNFNLGYHPLVPIYAILSPFYYSLSPKYDSHPFFYTYFTYFNVLEKMVDIIDRNYLNNASDKNKIIAAYLLGFSLKFFLFTSNTNIIQNNKILEVIGISQKDYYTFSLKNDIFANLMVGTIYLNDDEQQKGIILLESELFKNFINNEVNIKEILKQGTHSDDSLNYQLLQDRVLSLMTRIVTKVNIDRGTPQNNMFLKEPALNNLEEVPLENILEEELPQSVETSTINLKRTADETEGQPSEKKISSTSDDNMDSAGGKKTRKNKRQFKNRRTKRNTKRTKRKTRKNKRIRKNNKSRK